MAELLLAVVETPLEMAVMTWKDSLYAPTNNNLESANDDAFSRLLYIYSVVFFVKQFTT